MRAFLAVAAVFILASCSSGGGNSSASTSPLSEEAACDEFKKISVELDESTDRYLDYYNSGNEEQAIEENKTYTEISQKLQNLSVADAYLAQLINDYGTYSVAEGKNFTIPEESYTDEDLAELEAIYEKLDAISEQLLEICY